MSRIDRCQAYRKWSPIDYVLLGVLLIATGCLFFGGLSVRSLWGSEGRWAVIAREMMQSGNYFLPTINGQVYFDKPLLSYWAIIPFSLFSGVTETSARMPAVLAGIGTVALVFAMGRRLFGLASGFIAGAMVMTTAMFGFWSRTASAEVLNVLAIWSMVWALPRRTEEGAFARYCAFYVIGALSAFLKGPVAPAVAVFVAVAISLVELYGDAVHEGIRGARGRLTERFHWILSAKGMGAAICGLAVFAFFLFLPVMATGSWEAVSLMWRENVVRFLKPFDHVEPFYIYFKHVPVLLMPWTFLAAASLIDMSRWQERDERRWLAVVTAAIFLFFTISGSRRSYYILPIVPAFALIMGRAFAGFLDRREESPSAMKAALVVTAGISILAGFAMIVAFIGFAEYRHLSEVLIGPIAVALGIASLVYFLKARPAMGSIGLIAVFFMVLLWQSTVGAVIGEHGRSLRPFVKELSSRAGDAADDRLAMYGVTNSALFFYLNRGKPVPVLKDVSEACLFAGRKGNYILTEEALTDTIQKECGRVGLARVLSEDSKKGHRDREGLVVLQAGAGP